ncbi:DUF262 domain-containing protein [Treponema sp.]|uniref:DUF262 domain-containing protein n=1 Tax=Treponema sp. TaxID=166 RepID=UPI00257FEAE5|nr:DUF262 domain-containing protein [Treponema sp.]MBE6355247.1 DUF262 domain-containing protein [Treponema sp.]
MKTKVDTISVSGLLDKNFFIPAYQRGYRWDKQEIEELLDDLNEYAEKVKDRTNTVSNFYCIQPLVVKEKSWKDFEGQTISGYEVIDGQQRLTTIFLILQFLHDYAEDNNYNYTTFNLYFETRKNCETFFRNKEFTKIVMTNPDYAHISKGYEVINNWFTSKGNEQNKTKQNVLERLIDTDYDVRFILYETEEDSIDLFTRLNEGKIPLTDGELIKAELLQSDNYKNGEEVPKDIIVKLNNIAAEWDKYSCLLQDDKLWYFLNPENQKKSERIEILFKLLTLKWNDKKVLVNYEKTIPKHYIYIVFHKYFELKKNEFSTYRKANKKLKPDPLTPVYTIWNEVKEIFTLLLEWFSDNEWYHYIGYFLAISKEPIKVMFSLINSFQASDDSKGKIQLKEELKAQIGNHLKNCLKENDKVLNLEQLNYHEHPVQLINILTFFNVYSFLYNNNESSKFPFDLYKKNSITSLEHIHPQNPEDMLNDEERCIRWLKVHKKALDSLKSTLSPEKQVLCESNKKRISDLLSLYNPDKKNFNDIKVEFEKVFSDVLKDYRTLVLGTEEIAYDIDDNLFNLALVDKETNSALNNSFYDVKREILKSREKEGIYILPCTKKAFSKYYSDTPKEIEFWKIDDRKAYFDSIKKTISSFIEMEN